MILAVLRDRTRLLHEQVERTVAVSTRLRSVQLYGELVARFYGFYLPFEERLAQVDGYAALGLDFAARRKTHLLRDDLTRLGMSPAYIDSLPRCHELPAVTVLADALGCLYVLEGATLGGRIICREAENALGVLPGRGCSFWASYGERVGEMWKDFCRILERYAAATPGETERIITAAAGTFTCLDRWLAEGRSS